MHAGQRAGRHNNTGCRTNRSQEEELRNETEKRMMSVRRQ